MTDNLRLTAEVEDRFSEPLKRLHEDLLRVGSREHQGRLRELGDGFRRARESAIGFSESLKKTLEPSMDALGIGTIGVGAALAGIVEGSKRAGEQLAALGRASASLQVSPQFLKDQAAIGAHFGVQADEMTQGMSALQKNLFEARHYRGKCSSNSPSSTKATS